MPPHFSGKQNQRQRMPMAEIQHAGMGVLGDTVGIQQTSRLRGGERVQADAAHRFAPQRVRCPMRVRCLTPGQHHGGLRRQHRQQRIAHPAAHGLQVFKRVNHHHAAIRGEPTRSQLLERARRPTQPKCPGQGSHNAVRLRRQSGSVDAHQGDRSGRRLRSEALQQGCLANATRAVHEEKRRA